MRLHARTKARENAHFSHAHERADSLSRDKMVHDVSAHVGRLGEQNKKRVIVTARDGALHLQRVPNGLRHFLLGR